MFILENWKYVSEFLEIFLIILNRWKNGQMLVEFMFGWDTKLDLLL